jgi:hypothetical protein
MQGRIELLDDATQSRELRNLERRPRPGGKDAVDHPRGQHDDCANALCLVAAVMLRRGRWALHPTEPEGRAEAQEPSEDAASRYERERVRGHAESIAESCANAGWWFPGGR